MAQQVGPSCVARCRGRRGVLISGVRRCCAIPRGWGRVVCGLGRVGYRRSRGGSIRAAAVRLGVVVVRRMLARQAVGMPREKCLCRRSLERGEAEVVLDVPSISVMNAVVRGVPTYDLERRVMNLSIRSGLGEWVVLVWRVVVEDMTGRQLMGD